ncbi:MAG: KR domain-containing protein [Hydrococcus sp. RU_2_2]|nr:KR domain-containing protein [Hydrococcus sp. RU_2_2]
MASDRPLENTDLSEFDGVWSAKVTGAWILHQLTQEMSLDFSVNFSSIASVWGGKGQGVYAAANQFLDGLAHYRSSLGQPTWSINWGPWAGENMADAKFKTKLSRLGITPLSPATGIRALKALLSTNLIQATVARIDWHLFQDIYQSRRARLLFEQIAPATTTKPTSRSQSSGVLLHQLKQTPKRELFTQIKTYLQIKLAKILKLKPAAIEPQQGFFELGLDSLMVVELKNCLDRDFETIFSTSLIFNYSTLDKLASYLEDFLNGQTEMKIQERENQLETKEIDSLNPQELEQLLVREIQEIETLISY